jgi:hypothetical protein
MNTHHKALSAIQFAFMALSDRQVLYVSREILYFGGKVSLIDNLVQIEG